MRTRTNTDRNATTARERALPHPGSMRTRTNTDRNNVTRKWLVSRPVKDQCGPERTRIGTSTTSKAGHWTLRGSMRTRTNTDRNQYRFGITNRLGRINADQNEHGSELGIASVRTFVVPGGINADQNEHGSERELASPESIQQLMDQCGPERTRIGTTEPASPSRSRTEGSMRTRTNTDRNDRTRQFRRPIVEDQCGPERTRIGITASLSPWHWNARIEKQPDSFPYAGSERRQWYLVSASRWIET